MNGGFVTILLAVRHMIRFMILYAAFLDFPDYYYNYLNVGRKCR